MDIVERLRLRPEREMLYIDGCVSAGYGPTIEAQAADEIERLRSEVERCKAKAQAWIASNAELRAIADDLRRERDEWIDRCKEAQASA